MPKFRALPLRFPGVTRTANGEYPLFRTGTLLIAASAADRGIVFAFGQSLLQRIGLHDLCVSAAVIEWVNALAEPILIGVQSKVQPQSFRGRVAKRDHVAEFPCRIDVQERKRRP